MTWTLEEGERIDQHCASLPLQVTVREGAGFLIHSWAEDESTEEDA